MFVKLAFKNIKRSIKDYAIYFFTLVLGVAIFYVFNALDSQSVMLDVTDRARQMLELINTIMRIVSVFVSVILGALIIYASRFLIKRRSKEFGIYLTLGMSKRKISLILLIETFLIGLFSLAVGLILGVIVSQFMSILVANMFDANMTNFHFVFSWSACVQTLIYFGIIYLVVMVFNTIVVNRQKLINLLSSNRRNEKIKMKNPWLCTAVFIIACIILGIAYYLVTDGLLNFIGEEGSVNKLLVPIVMGASATFLLFWSLSGLLLRIFMSLKQVYYHKLNSFVLRQFSSKINTTVVSMSLICLMLFVTICVLGSALSINTTLHQNIEKTLPMDAQITGIGQNAIAIKDVYKREDINLDNILTDVIDYKTYTVENFTTTNTIDNSALQAAGNTDGTTSVTTLYSTIEPLIHVSEYNTAAKVFGLPEVELKDDEYAMLANYRLYLSVRDASLKAGKTFELYGKTYHPKYDHCIVGSIKLESASMNDGIIIVPDNVKFTGKDIYEHEYLLGNYRENLDPAEAERTLMSLSNRFFSEDGENTDDDDERPVLYYYNVETKQEIIDNNVGTSAMVTFIGLYIGIIFLISSAAVLALKELSESSDNREKYTILRKIGASNSMLNRALFWQIFIFFLFPLLIAIIHSIFGLMFCDFILSTMGGIDIIGSLPAVSGILLAIYGGYFVITYLCSRNIIREHRN